MSRFSIGTGVLDFLADDAALNTGIRRVERTMQRIQTRMNQIGYAARNALVVSSAALAGAFRESVRFDKQMTKVQTVMGRNTAFATEYRKAVQDMSVEFGKSTQDISDALYDIISAGVAPADALMVLRSSLRASTAGFADARVGARGLTAILAAYQIKASEVTQVSDAMFQAVNMGKLEFTDLAQSIGRVAPLAYQAGISLNSLLAAISTITNTGVSASESVTQMSGFIKAFVRPSLKSAKAAKKYGVELGHNAIRGENLIKTLQKLRAIQQKFGVEAIAEIFPDIRGMRGALSLTTNFENFMKSIEEMGKSGGATMTAFNQVSSSTDFQIQRLKQAWIGLAVTVGTAVTPLIMQLTGWLQRMIPVIQAWVRDHSAMIQSTIKWGAALLTAGVVIPKVVSFIRLLAFGLQGLIVVLRLATMAMGSLGGIIVTAGVAALVLFIATVARSRAMNETWSESAYAMARALGLFHNPTQDLAVAMAEAARAGDAAQEAWLKWWNVLRPANKDLQTQIDTVRDAVEAQQQRIGMLREAARAEREQGVTTHDAAKALESARMELRKYEGALRKLEAEKQALLTPEATMKDFKLPDLGDLQAKMPKLEIKPPQFRSLADLHTEMQKAVFSAADPTRENTNATKENTGALGRVEAKLEKLAKGQISAEPPSNKIGGIVGP